MLKGIRIENYCSIKDSQSWQIPEDRISILAGLNGAGKTVLLESINLLKNSVTSIPENKFRDYDRTLDTKIHVTLKDLQPPFSGISEDVLEIKENEITITKIFHNDPSQRYMEYEINGIKLINIYQNIIKKINEKLLGDLKKNLNMPILKTHEELPRFFQKIYPNILQKYQDYDSNINKEKIEESKENLEIIKTNISLLKSLKSLETKIINLLPRIEEFDYDKWKNVRNYYSNENIVKDTLIKAIFKEFGIDPNSFVLQSENKKLSLIEQANQSFNEFLQEYWPHGEVILKLIPDNNGIKIRVLENDNYIDPESRSGGEQWFLTFIIILHKIMVANRPLTIITMDEPSLRLHPVAQRTICTLMDSFLNDHPSFIFLYSTHSPYMIHPKDIKRLSRVVKSDEEGTKLVPFSLKKLKEIKNERLTKVKTDEESVSDFLFNIVTHESIEGLFSRKVILCEGLTEKLILPVYAKSKTLDFDKLGYTIIITNGKGPMIEYAEFYSHLKIPVFIIFDNDSDKKTVKDSKRYNRWLCDFIGLPQKDFPTGCRENFYIFNPKFEVVLKINKDYQAFNIEFSEKYGGNERKPLRARFIAQKFIDEKKTLPNEINDLIGMIFKED